MKFEWDERKRISNLAKHGVDFRDAMRFVWPRATIRTDERRDYGEERRIAVGPLDGRIHVLIYTVRQQRRRVISLRKARAKEVRQYETEIDIPDAGGG